MATTVAVAVASRVRVCFAVKLSTLLPYYERDLFIIERVDVCVCVYIYIYVCIYMYQ